MAQNPGRLRLTSGTTPHTFLPEGDQEHRELTRRLAPTPLILVPLHARGTRLGVLVLASIRTDRYCQPDDFARARELGRIASIAIDNARQASRPSRSDVIMSSMIRSRVPAPDVVHAAELPHRDHPHLPQTDLLGAQNDGVGDREGRIGRDPFRRRTGERERCRPRHGVQPALVDSRVTRLARPPARR
jgi:hypothetical protein